MMADRVMRKDHITLNWKVLGTIGLLVTCIFAATYFWLIIKEHKRVMTTELKPIDLVTFGSGDWNGEFTFAGFTYKVRFTTRFGELTGIEIVQNNNTKYAKLAEGIIPKVLAKGNIDVDTVSGATVSSRVLLLAIANGVGGEVDDC